MLRPHSTAEPTLLHQNAKFATCNQLHPVSSMSRKTAIGVRRETFRRLAAPPPFRVPNLDDDQSGDNNNDYSVKYNTLSLTHCPSIL
ncbi:hypothetical protein KC333_g12 [Hortaea werneckii]|nr:hypothetical protein KC333_g12 [Hortaea werneckii]